jgi:hypothetical protein
LLRAATKDFSQTCGVLTSPYTYCAVGAFVKVVERFRRYAKKGRPAEQQAEYCCSGNSCTIAEITTEVEGRVDFVTPQHSNNTLGPTLALINRLGTAYFGRPTSVGGCMIINKSGLEIETKGTMEETEDKFRGDLGKAAADTSEHVKGRAEEAMRRIEKDFGKTERQV